MSMDPLDLLPTDIAAMPGPDAATQARLAARLRVAIAAAERPNALGTPSPHLGPQLDRQRRRARLLARAVVLLFVALLVTAGVVVGLHTTSHQISTGSAPPYMPDEPLVASLVSVRLASGVAYSAVWIPTSRGEAIGSAGWVGASSGSASLSPLAGGTGWTIVLHDGTLYTLADALDLEALGVGDNVATTLSERWFSVLASAELARTETAGLDMVSSGQLAAALELTGRVTRARGTHEVDGVETVEFTGGPPRSVAAIAAARCSLFVADTHLSYPVELACQTGVGSEGSGRLMINLSEWDRPVKVTLPSSFVRLGPSGVPVAGSQSSGTSVAWTEVDCRSGFLAPSDAEALMAHFGPGGFCIGFRSSTEIVWSVVKGGSVTYGETKAHTSATVTLGRGGSIVAVLACSVRERSCTEPGAVHPFSSFTVFPAPDSTTFLVTGSPGFGDPFLVLNNGLNCQDVFDPLTRSYYNEYGFNPLANASEPGPAQLVAPPSETGAAALAAVAPTPTTTTCSQNSIPTTLVEP